MSNQYKLSIKIDNKTPIELNQLTASLNALANQYDSFLKKSNDFDYKKHERKLYISKLESGSVYAELVPYVVPLLTHMNSIIQFGQYLKTCYDYFLNKENKNEYLLDKKDYLALSNIIEPTANDNNGNIAINIIKGDNNNIHQSVININTLESNAIQNAISKHNNIEDTSTLYTKELMYWANANFLKNHKQTTGKVIIEKINKKPKKVIFVNADDEKYTMSSNDTFPNIDWQNLCYVVDVEVSYIEEEPQLYKVLKLYNEETYNPND